MFLQIQKGPLESPRPIEKKIIIFGNLTAVYDNPSLARQFKRVGEGVYVVGCFSRDSNGEIEKLVGIDTDILKVNTSKIIISTKENIREIEELFNGEYNQRLISAVHSKRDDFSELTNISYTSIKSWTSNHHNNPYK